jgi:hypothetical protein
MTSSFETVPPDGWFTPPGTLRISTSALELAREFRDQARESQPDEDWIVSYDWADSRRVREKGSNDWRDLGAGLDLTAYERWKIPEKHIQKTGDLEIVVKIPPQIWQKSKERLIDTDDTIFSGLILR